LAKDLWKGEMSQVRPTPTHVALIGTCPRCGESVELIVTKKQAKLIWKTFKLSIKEAQLYGEKGLEKETRHR